METHYSSNTTNVLHSRKLYKWCLQYGYGLRSGSPYGVQNRIYLRRMVLKVVSRALTLWCQVRGGCQ